MDAGNPHTHWHIRDLERQLERAYNDLRLEQEARKALQDKFNRLIIYIERNVT